MCLIFLSLNQHPTYKLIVVANRDEFYNRQTAPAGFWIDHPEILGGRDLEAGGTWMAVNRKGKISMITNYRDLSNINPNAPSRGFLVSDFLIQDNSGEKYLKEVELKAKEYNGFNLIVGDADSFWYLSNYKKGVERIPDGFHGLSNHLLDTEWPKVKRGSEMLKPMLVKEKIDPQQLFELMYDDLVAADNLLPQTGLPLERERALSSMFIKSPNYGSRCSTVVLIDNDNNVSFTERVYDIHTFAFQEQTFQFKY
jgi:uncharacterized protein with NRDE domain